MTLARLHPAVVVPAAWHAVQAWLADNGPQLGAAVAFYSIFALAPLLVVAIALAGAVFGAEAARGQIVAQIAGLVGTDAATGIEAMIASASRSPHGGLAAVVGLVTLLAGASGVFVQLRNALNIVLHGGPARPGLGTLLRVRMTAFALVLGFGFLMIVTLLLSAALAAIGAWVGSLLPEARALLAVFDVALSALVLTAAFAALLAGLPDTPPRRRTVWIGAVTAALLFSIGKHLVGLYLARASVASSFGAAGSFVVVILWIYYSAQLLLLAAAFGRELDNAWLRRDRRDPASRRLSP